jgi:hypothetical protein
MQPGGGAADCVHLPLRETGTCALPDQHTIGGNCLRGVTSLSRRKANQKRHSLSLERMEDHLKVPVVLLTGARTRELARSRI